LRGGRCHTHWTKKYKPPFEGTWNPNSLILFESSITKLKQAFHRQEKWGVPQWGGTSRSGPTCAAYLWIGQRYHSACWLGLGLREWGVEGDGGLRLF